MYLPLRDPNSSGTDANVIDDKKEVKTYFPIKTIPVASKSKIGIAYPMFVKAFSESLNSFIEVASEENIGGLDLIIFSGGEDIDPHLYGQTNTHSYINPIRDRYEVFILALALKKKKKILGSCRGHQLINAHFGGDLIQDIEVTHDYSHKLTKVKKGSLVDVFFPKVNSLHHQGVTLPGKHMIPTAYFGDKDQEVIEASESEDGRIISFQFHPELMDEEAKDFFLYIKECWIGEKNA